MGLFFRKIDPEKDSKYRQWLNSMLVVAILITSINSLFLNWGWLDWTMAIVIGILAILIFKEYKGEE
ncbi:hypothetical protein [Priestia megaterium]|uniref:hypothetical protein n=1 Tax=Priestia megaterium TaxID=1404 RepID=UPI000BF4C3A0|nr:hypothetical protein [Priestia megaterium]MCA4157762.1 hypothetical protein [Priestia megaterium]MCM3196781.1 hypothetical protein [Priestia megaterium]MDR7207497.1 fatty acid desaturase [Priestia megaterium]PFR90660.1 hypothetical protein COK39_24505 [Priestia megaterium]